MIMMQYKFVGVECRDIRQSVLESSLDLDLDGPKDKVPLIQLRLVLELSDGETHKHSTSQDTTQQTIGAGLA